jgi:hypothetical protein
MRALLFAYSLVGRKVRNAALRVGKQTTYVTKSSFWLRGS